MCSIVAILNIGSEPAEQRELALRLSARVRHRGPDWSGVFADERAVLAHERLAIAVPHVDADFNVRQPVGFVESVDPRE